MFLRSLALVVPLSCAALAPLASTARADEAPPKPLTGEAPKDAPADAPKDPAGEAKPGEVPGDAPKDAPPEKELSEAEQLKALKAHLGAIDGPSKGAPLGDIATIDVPAGYWFVPKAGTTAFDQLIENIHDDDSCGVLVKGDTMDSVVYFSFDPIGYVDDKERDLDSDDLLKTMREGTTQSNIQRQQMGYKPIELIGWVKEPFYNEATQSLEWALSFRESGATDEGTANYNTRRLGREGVMSVTLATTPAQVPTAVVEMNKNLGGFAYVAGKDYGSYKEGDRMAEIGLGALVVGGGAVALTKLGFFSKFWKLLAAGGAVVVGGIAKLFGRKKKEPEIVVPDHDRT